MAQYRPATSKDLIITCVKGEGTILKFWALPLTAIETVKTFETHFVRNRQELDQTSGFLNSNQTPVGFKGAVFSQIKRAWCRARVIQVIGFSEIIVQLIDYGNEELVSVADVRSLDESFFRYPPQALECILADVMPTTGEWPPDAIRFCEHHLLFQTVSCFVTSHHQKVPEVRIAKKGESDPFVQRLINSGLAYIKPADPIQQHPQSVVQQQIGYKMNKLDVNTTHLVKISFLEPRKFFVQLTAVELELKKLMDEIRIFTTQENLLLLNAPQINTPCLARYSSKQLYYRAIITSVVDGRCSLLFVDYGCTEEKPFEDLRAIPSRFLALHAQAICCILKPGDLESEKCFNAAKHSHLNLHVLGQTSEAYIVRLSTHDKDSLPLQVPIVPASTVMMYQRINLKVRHSYEVTVSYTNDINEFYCQLVQFKEQLDYISSTLNRCKFEPLSFQECEPKLPVCVKFSEDNVWYRALINKVNNESDIEVFFVDFGNYDNANLRDICKMKPELMTLPMQAHKCCLFEVESPADSSLRDDMFDVFEELTTGQTLTMCIQTVTEEQSYAVALQEKNSNSTLSINEKLQSKFISISPIKVSDIENLYITSFTSPDSFFAQFEKLSSTKLEEMQMAINEFYATANNASFKPKIGNFVCAKYLEDEQYYRAIVENVSGVQCDVMFLDYGNRESISLKDIHPMNVKFTSYPQFGVECGLESFPPATPVDKLKSLMLENSVQAKMITVENRKWKVALTEDFNGNVAILEMLRQHEMVVPRSIHGAGLQGYREPSPKLDCSNTYNQVYQERKSDYQNKQPVNSCQTLKNDTYSNQNETIAAVSNPRQYTKSFDVISIPSNAYRNVYVSHVVNPSEFYSQIEEESAKLQAMMTAIEEIYSKINDNDLNFVKLVVDSPCCAVFEEDGSWYRGQIRQVSSGSCLVYFIDYGNSEMVLNTKVKELKREFFSLPPQAVKCKTFNVTPKGETWCKADIDTFIKMTLDKSFVAQFVECDTKGFYAVNLVSIGKLQEDVLNKEFVTLGHGQLKDSSKTIVLNSHAASSNLSYEQPIVPLGSKEAVTVSYGLNPGEVFCQLKSSENKFKKLMFDLQEFCNGNSSADSLVDRPHQGMICVAQFYMDSAWYRGEIRKVASNSITVCYVDYGNCETVDKKKIRCITQDFVNLPIQAIKCHLKGIKPPGQSWKSNQNIGKYFEGNVQCQFIEKINGSYVVNIECNGKSVAEQLVKDRLAVSDGSIKPETFYREPQQAFAAKDDNTFRSDAMRAKPSPPQNITRISQTLPKRNDAFVLGQLLSVVVSYVESPAKFWCQLLDDSENLEQLMADIEVQYSASNNLLNATNITIGTYCIAKYSVDEAWYRAQIKSCISNNEYEVFFIDYGNSEITSSSQLATILPKFLNLPPQCFECQLYRSPSSDTTKTDEFNTLVTEAEELTAKVEKVVSDISIVTLLLEKDGDEMDVRDHLFGETSEETIPVIVDMLQFPPPEIPLGLQEGYVTEVNSPHNFYIQLAGIEDDLAELSTQFSELYEGQDVPKVENPAVGCACAAKYSEDNSWYRAEVTKIEGSTADVVFVDYGNISNVPLDSLKRVNQKYLTVPPYAIKCKLNGITPFGEQWIENSIETFREMVLDCPLGIAFISKDVPAIVNITKEEKDIGQSLVDQELASVYTCPETEEAYTDDHLTAVEDQLHSLPTDLRFPRRKLASSKLSVKISYVDSYSKFYCMPVELSTALDSIMTSLELLLASPPKDETTSVPKILEDPNPMMACLAKYSEDDAWYRALITDIEGSNIYVTFVDYGNSEVTTVENLRSITPEMIEIPPLAVQCKLYGIQAIEGKEQEISDKLEQYYIEELEVEMEVLNASEPYDIKLCAEEDLADLLCKDGWAIKITPPPETIDDVRVETINENVKENLQTAFVELPEVLQNTLPVLPVSFDSDTPFSVKFCEIENEVVVVHAVPNERDEELTSFVEKIQLTYNETEKRLDHVEMLSLCAAKYTEDESWYRAQVLECDSENIKVNFIDYGNTENVKIENVCELLPEFMNEPKFSIKFSLSGCKVRKDKNEEIQNKLDEILYEDNVFFKTCEYSHCAPDHCVVDIKCGEVGLVETLVNDKLLALDYTLNPRLSDTFKATIESFNEETFYLLPIQFVEDRDKLQEHLQEVCCDISASNEEIDFGRLYSAKVNELWSRVKVLVVNSDDESALVLCVDYGTQVDVKLSELVLLPLEMCHSPLLLQPCLLLNYESSPNNVKNRDIDLIKGYALSCKTQKNKFSHYPLQIEMFEEQLSTALEAEEVTITETIQPEDINTELKFQNMNDNQEDSFVDALGGGEPQDTINYQDGSIEASGTVPDPSTGKMEQTSKIDAVASDPSVIAIKDLKEENEEKSCLNEEQDLRLMDSEGGNISGGVNEEADRCTTEKEFHLKEDLEVLPNLQLEGTQQKQANNYNAADAESKEEKCPQLMVKDLKDQIYDKDEEISGAEKENKQSYAQALSKMSEDGISASKSMSKEAIKKVSGVPNEIPHETLSEEISKVLDKEIPESLNQETFLLNGVNNGLDEASVEESLTYGKSSDKRNNVRMEVDDGALPGEEPEDESASLLPEDVRPNDDAVDIYLSDSESLEDAKNKEPEDFESELADVCAESDLDIVNQQALPESDECHPESMESDREEEVEAESLGSRLTVEADVCAESDLDLAVPDGIEAMQELDECHDARPECDIKPDLDEASEFNAIQGDSEVQNFKVDRTESSADSLDNSIAVNAEAQLLEVLIETEKKNISIEKISVSKLFEDLMHSSWQQSSGKLKVVVSDVMVESGLVLLTIEPSPDELSLALFNASHERYGAKQSELTDSSDLNFCAVHLANEWHRAKILDSTENTMTVFLIDGNKTESVDISAVKDLEEAHRPQQLSLSCVLASASCCHDKSKETEDFLASYLKDSGKDIYVELVESGDPFKTSLYVNGNNILQQLLSKNLVVQKIPSTLVQSGIHSAKMAHLISNLGQLELHVNLVSQLDDLHQLTNSMMETYPLNEKVPVTESSVHAVFCDNTWYRGVMISSSEDSQLNLMDSGKKVSLDSLTCFLLPNHCLHPPFAIRCEINENIPDKVEVLEAISKVLDEKEFLVDVQVNTTSLEATATIIDEDLIKKIRGVTTGTD